MAKIIKEIIIILLICLISMLAIAVVLYDYIPNRKVVAEVSTYTTSQEIETQLEDDIDSEDKEVVLTYEVTSKDLSSYEISNEYVPGKANPFAGVVEEPEGEALEGDVTDEGEDATNNTTNTTQTIPSGENIEETNSFIEDEGIK